MYKKIRDKISSKDKASEFRPIAPDKLNDLKRVIKSFENDPTPIQWWLSYANLIQDGKAIRQRPQQFIGRDAILAKAIVALEKGETVCLYGSSGMGKTAIVKELQMQWLMRQRGSILDMYAGQDAPDGLFHSLARRGKMSEKMMLAETDKDKQNLARTIVDMIKPSLIVIDGVNDVAQVSTFIEVIDSIPVLLVSRVEIPNTTLIHVDKFSEQEALALLQLFAPYEVNQHSLFANQLCELLDYLPLAIHIVGHLLSYEPAKWTIPKLLLHMAEKREVLNINITAKGQLALLIQTCLDICNDMNATRLFKIAGNFFDGTINSKMLALYDFQVPVIPDSQIQWVRENNPEFITPHMSDDSVRNLIIRQQVLKTPLNTSAYDRWLKTFHQLGLYRYDPEQTEIIEGQRYKTLAEYYYIPILVYQYAQALKDTHIEERILSACLHFVQRYSDPQNWRECQVNLSTNRNNIIYAGEEVYRKGRHADFFDFHERLLIDMRFIQSLGQFAVWLKWETYLVEIGRSEKNQRLENRGLGNLGTIYLNIKSYSTARQYMKEAIRIAEELEDYLLQTGLLRQVGYTHFEESNYDDALYFYEKSLGLAQQNQLVFDEYLGLQALGEYYLKQDKLEKAKTYFEQSLPIAKPFNNVADIYSILNNLGWINYLLKDYDMALQYLEESMSYSQKVGSKYGLAMCLYYLGRAYLALEDYELAHAHLEDAKHWRDRLKLVDQLTDIEDHLAICKEQLHNG